MTEMTGTPPTPGAPENRPGQDSRSGPGHDLRKDTKRFSSVSRKNRFDIRKAAAPILIVMGLFLAGNLAFYALLVRPKVREFQAVSDAGSPRIQALQAKRDRVEELEAFVLGLEQARDDLKKLRTEVLSTREQRMVDVQREIEALCQRFSIALDQVTYDYPKLPAEQLEGVRMIVPLEGGYGALRKFLNAVEESDKFLLVERVVLVQGQDGGVLLQLNITLTTYFDAPPEGGSEGRV